MAIGLQGLGPGPAALPEHVPAQESVEGAGQEVHGQAQAKALVLDPVDEALGGLQQDEHGGQGDQATFEGGAEMLDLAVPVGVLFVGGPAGEDHRPQGEQGRHDIHDAFDGIGLERHGPGEHIGQVLQAEEGRPRHDGQQRKADPGGLFDVLG